VELKFEGIFEKEIGNLYEDVEKKRPVKYVEIKLERKERGAMKTWNATHWNLET